MIKLIFLTLASLVSGILPATLQPLGLLGRALMTATGRSIPNVDDHELVFVRSESMYSDSSITDINEDPEPSTQYWPFNTWRAWCSTRNNGRPGNYL